MFYFGNLVGETGDSLTPTKVSSADLADVKRVLNTNAGPGSRYDINRDGKVNALDLGIVRAAPVPAIGAHRRADPRRRGRADGHGRGRDEPAARGVSGDASREERARSVAVEERPSAGKPAR